MHALVQDATGHDFHAMRDDLEGARSFALAALQSAEHVKERKAVAVAKSVGVIVNCLFEVRFPRSVQTSGMKPWRCERAMVVAKIKSVIIIVNCLF